MAAPTKKPKVAVHKAKVAAAGKPKAARRVKAKIKAQVAGLRSTRDARATRVKAAVAAVKSTRTTRGRAKSTSTGVPAPIATARRKRTQRGAVPNVTTARAKLPGAVVKPTGARIKTTAVKAKSATGRRVTSTEEREVAALAIADAHAAAATGPGKPRPRRPRTAKDAFEGAPANENASTLSAAPLATIAPRGVFLPDRVVVDVEGDTFPRTTLDEHGRDESILSGSAFEALKQQVATGQRLVDGDAPAAFRAFRAALDLLPEPVQNWNAAGWLLVAMGECAIRTGDFAAAVAPLKDAMHCPGTIGNPWVHLLLGRCRLELGDERAADELARAYMGGGRALFDGLDPKYFALVEHVLKPPPGHDRLP